MKQNIIYKKNFSKLKSVIKNSGHESVFLVRANKSYFTSGANIFIENIISDNTYTSFFEFNPNPQLKDLERGLALFKQGNYKTIIAIGGGSVIDMAKLISVFAHQNSSPKDIILNKASINNLKTPLIAIPTTAGTGAEATHFAVLYIKKNKYSVAHSNILPNTVYLSSEFSLSASKYLTACTGLDAFCQAIESVWSVNSNTESESYALKAINIIWNNLKNAVHKSDKISKDNMLEASFLAGKAINLTKTTAPHAISYAFTSYYNIPHGHAVALSLPFFLQYNYNVSSSNCTDKRGFNSVKDRIDKILNILNINIEESYTKLDSFFNSLGVNISVDNLINNFNKNIIADNINIERLNNNPRKITIKIIKSIFK